MPSLFADYVFRLVQICSRVCKHKKVHDATLLQHSRSGQ